MTHLVGLLILFGPVLAVFGLGTRTVLSDSTNPENSPKPEGNCFLVEGSNDKIVCACNKQNCDVLSYQWPDTSGQSYLITSSSAGHRFALNVLSGETTGSPIDEAVEIHIDLNTEHQSIMGFGGAFTDATGINVKSLTKEVADKLMASYFGEDGLQYNFGRVPIGGSDFSSRPYSYDDTENETDYDLKEWSLAKEDLNYKIPLIKQAMILVSETNTTLKLFGSPWSPPRWMKDNRSFTRGHLKDDEQIYQSYANYIVKFYDTYKEHGINFWGGTLQNEPWSAIMDSSYFFNSLELGNDQAIKLIGDHLGPALESHGYTKENFKLMVGDDNLGRVNNQVPSIMMSEKVKKYVSGFAFHWYGSGSSAPYDDIFRAIDPIKGDIEFTLMTEACNGFILNDTHVSLGSWHRGQMYASDIIQDMLRQTSGWIDWNMALDKEGGPNWANNFVDSPIIVDKDKDTFYKQPMFYVLGHFSRHFRPGSKRIESTIVNQSFRGDSKEDDLQAVAVKDEKSSHLIVNILNCSKETKTVQLTINGSQHKIEPIKVDKKSINTIILKL